MKYLKTYYGMYSQAITMKTNITCKKCENIFQAPFNADRRNVRGSGKTLCPNCGNMVSIVL